MLFLAVVCNAQVGINTQTPAGMLHVKGTTGTNNDVVVKETTGNVGIGTTNPTEKLHVVGNAKEGAISTNNMDAGRTLVKGKTGLGTTSPTAKVEVVGTSTNAVRIEGNSNPTSYVMTSDADGIGTWRYLRPDSEKRDGTIRGGNGSSTSTRLNPANSYIEISTARLTLGKGKWLIVARGILYRASTGASHFVEMALMEGTTSLTTLYEVGVVTRYATGSPKIAIPQISAIIHNQDNANKTYSVHAKATESNYYTYNDATNLSPYFYAIKLDDQ